MGNGEQKLKLYSTFEQKFCNSAFGEGGMGAESCAINFAQLLNMFIDILLNPDS